MVRPLGKDSFFKYYLLILTKVIKLNHLTPILAYTFYITHLSFLIIYNCEIFYKINKALQ